METPEAFADEAHGFRYTVPERGRHATHKPCFVCGRRDGPYYRQLQRRDGSERECVLVYCEDHAAEMARFGEAQPAHVPAPFPNSRPSSSACSPALRS